MYFASLCRADYCSAVVAVRRYYSGFRSLVCAFVVCAEEKKAGSKNKSFVVVFLGASSRAYDTASFDSVSKKSTSPTVMFTSQLVLPSAMTWTEKSACVANLPRSHQHTRARFLLLLLFMVLLYCVRLWCCYYLCLALSSRHL